MAKSPVEQAIADLRIESRTRDAKQFLEDVLGDPDMPTSLRMQAAVAVLPYQHAKLHAIYTTIDQNRESFESWLDKLTGPGKQLIDHELKLLPAPYSNGHDETA